MLRNRRIGVSTAGIAFAFSALVGTFGFAPRAAAQSATARLQGHLPALAARSRVQGRVAAQEVIRLVITLPVRNEAKLDALLASLYTPGDPSYQHYLTPEQFAADFGATQADYAAVAAYAKKMGLTVGDAFSNRLVLEVSGTAQQVETAFGVHLMNYRAPDNRVFRAPDAAPTVPAALASRIAGIIGLDTAVVRRPHYVKRSATPNAKQPHDGTGPLGGYSAADIKTAYNLNNTGLDGSGQTLGLYELDGYRVSDVTAYEKAMQLRAVPLQNVLLNGVDGRSDFGREFRGR